MGTQYAAVDGCVTERVISYHETRAQGAARLAIIKNTSVSRLGVCMSHQLKMGKDKFILGLRCVIDGIHAQEAKTANTMGHRATRARPEPIGAQPMDLSAIVVMQTVASATEKGA